MPHTDPEGVHTLGGPRGKGDRHLLCEAPEGPFRQKVPVTFSAGRERLPDPSSTHVFVCGYPGDVGGANTELWHTVRIWRRFGFGVTLIPTWRAEPKWRARLDEIGCRTIEARADELARVPGLAGSVVVSMCNTRFLAVAERFRRLGCRIVWVGCMNWLFPAERLHYRRHGTFDVHVFQSRYQRDQLAPQLARFGLGADGGVLIGGALALDEFPMTPRPHVPAEPFTVGRISRAAADKFSPRTWGIFSRVPHPLRVRVLGFGSEVQERVGPPPRWAECLPAASQIAQQFLPTLHAMVHAGGEATENWPRVGLEAMATGVPLVADHRGGWPEMIDHGRTGYLCRTDDEFAYYTARLAYDEEHRRDIIGQARARLECELANAEVIGAAWQALFRDLGERK